MKHLSWAYFWFGIDLTMPQSRRFLESAAGRSVDAALFFPEFHEPQVRVGWCSVMAVGVMGDTNARHKIDKGVIRVGS